MSQTRDQQRFTISKQTADSHEPMSHTFFVLTDTWTRGAASRHTITPISHTRLSPGSLQ